MKDFHKFVGEALPEVERVAMEMAEHYQTLRYPLNQYFKATADLFSRNGFQLDRKVDSIHVSEMNKSLADAKRNGYHVFDFNHETKVFTLRKDYIDGKYAIVILAPYDKDAIDIDVTEE